METEEEKKVYQHLNSRNITFVTHKHPPVYTVDEAKAFWEGIPGQHCKNLFLRDKKGRNHFLVVLLHDKKLDIKKLSRQIGSDTLSFASSSRLMKYLGVEPGSVTPLGIINDKEKKVQVIVDKDLLDGDTVNVHPNINTRTITLKIDDFRKFLDNSGNRVRYLEL